VAPLRAGRLGPSGAECGRTRIREPIRPSWGCRAKQRGWGLAAARAACSDQLTGNGRPQNQERHSGRTVLQRGFCDFIRPKKFCSVQPRIVPQAPRGDLHHRSNIEISWRALKVVTSENVNRKPELQFQCPAGD
jgi:hypothetical protein